MNQLFDFDTTYDAGMRELEGTLQRVNYQRKELTIIAEGRVWHFDADGECRYLFDEQPTMLRCFHPLDHVRVRFLEGEPRHRLKAIFGHEKPC